ncbi:MAG: M28 family peptidase [Bacteroidia bacterium]
MTALFVACEPEPVVDNNTTTTTTGQNITVNKKPRVIPPVFNEDSAFQYIKVQSDMGPRVPGTKAHEAAVTYYEKELKRFGAEVIIQKGNAKTFDGKTWLIKNVIGVFQPEKSKRVLLCAHFDSRPFCEKELIPELKSKPCPGVNDGASGVGVLLEVARQISLKNPEIGIDIIFFDLEDYGDNGGMPDTWCLGSQYWSKNPHKIGYTAEFGILLDMVGAADAKFPKEGISMFYAKDIVDKVWKAADISGAGAYFLDIETGEMTDDHSFINTIIQIPTIDILHYDGFKNNFFEHHHTTKDDLSTIDRKTLKGVGQTLLEVVYNE